MIAFILDMKSYKDEVETFPSIPFDASKLILASSIKLWNTFKSPSLNATRLSKIEPEKFGVSSKVDL